MEDWFEKHVSKDVVVVLESSGNSFGVFERLNAVGYSVIVLESTKIGQMAKGLCDNDKLAAVRIARCYLTGLSDEVWVPDSKTRERREVFAAYKRADTDRTRANNRIKSLLNEHTVRLGKKYSNLALEKSRAYISNVRPWTETQNVLLQEAFLDLDRASKKKKRLLQTISKDIAQNAELLNLFRLYGIGVVTAYGLMAMIGNIARFKSQKQLVAYFGLAPKYKQSGNNAKSGGIYRRGRRDIRSLLIQAGHTVLKNNSKQNHMFSWAWKMSYRKGKQKAVVAVARKLVVAVWYLMNGKPFNMKEASETLRRKVGELAKILGKEEIRNRQGFVTYKLFTDSRLQMMESWC
jgi:transposase